MHACEQRGVDVGEGLAVGVVEVAGELVDGDTVGDGLDEGGSAVGGADADGVAEGNFIAAAIEEGGGYVGDFGGLDFAFVGATEDAGDVAAYADVGGGRGGEYRRESF